MNSGPPPTEPPNEPPTQSPREPQTAPALPRQLLGLMFLSYLLIGSLVALTGMRQLFVEPLANTGTNIAWLLIQLLPLLAPLPGVMRARTRSFFILSLTSLLYFVHGVLVVFDDHLRWFGAFEILCSLALCALATIFVRRRREHDAAAGHDV